MNGLEARLIVERAAFRLDLELQVPAGGVVALLGSNGAGKSTAIAALAGAVPLASGGRVVLDGRVLDDPSDGVHAELERRSVGWVFQDPLLFPHLTVAQNAAFGLRAAGMPRRESAERAGEWLSRFRIAELASSRPGRISGGQAQRVALARALAPQPHLLLLDEPLAALDVEVRDDIRRDLRGRLRQHPGCTVLVTHDAVDAVELADEIVVLDRGRVVQRGTAAELSRAPATPYVAAMFPGG